MKEKLNLSIPQFPHSRDNRNRIYISRRIFPDIKNCYEKNWSGLLFNFDEKYDKNSSSVDRKESKVVFRIPVESLFSLSHKRLMSEIHTQSFLSWDRVIGRLVTWDLTGFSFLPVDPGCFRFYDVHSQGIDTAGDGDVCSQLF